MGKENKTIIISIFNYMMAEEVQSISLSMSMSMSMELSAFYMGYFRSVFSLSQIACAVPVWVLVNGVVSPPPPPPPTPPPSVVIIITECFI